jgi:glycosyltransferase involved in cell wall biosynthesis
LDSLRAQTLADWVCEVHNDDPDDDTPSAVVAVLSDPRIRLITHARNLGARATFDLVFRSSAEPFYSLLEDDNWWEPRFLEVMVAALAARPSVTVAWCNQRIWQERPDGTWSDTGNCVKPREDPSPRLVAWGHPRQALGALHANGAMLVRSRPGQAFPAPDVPFTAVEPTRERQFPHPLLYVPEPLAIYAVTRRTERAGDRSEWFAFQVVLLATYVRHAKLDDAGIAALWRHHRASCPVPSNVFLCAALVDGRCRALLRHATGRDWRQLMRSAIGHPVSVWRAWRVRQRRPHWWDTLDRHTADRFAEAAAASPR